MVCFGAIGYVFWLLWKASRARAALFTVFLVVPQGECRRVRVELHVAVRQAREQQFQRAKGVVRLWREAPGALPALALGGCGHVRCGQVFAGRVQGGIWRSWGWLCNRRDGAPEAGVPWTAVTVCLPRPLVWHAPRRALPLPAPSRPLACPLPAPSLPPPCPFPPPCVRPGQVRTLASRNISTKQEDDDDSDDGDAAAKVRAWGRGDSQDWQVSKEVGTGMASFCAHSPRSLHSPSSAPHLRGTNQHGTGTQRHTQDKAAPCNRLSG